MKEAKSVNEDNPARAIEFINLQTAQLWYISKNFTDIVEEMAKETIKILFDEIKKRGGHRRVVLEGELLERESTKRITKE